MGVLRAEAARARLNAAGGRTLGIPGEAPERADIRFSTQLRAAKVERDGMQWYRLEGYASTVEQSYRMYDWYGEYDEVIDAGAFGVTLAASPMVVYRENHAGKPMATTRNGRLELRADSTGLEDIAHVNPNRSDVADLVRSIEDQDVSEQSFMFRIIKGKWSPDYTEYRITEVDLDRGDVGPVTYGANPGTSVAARSADFLAELQHMPPGAARAALQVLSARADITERDASTFADPNATVAGRSLGMLAAQLGRSAA